MKSKRKRQATNFVRIVRAETALNAYTRALGYVLSRDRDQAVRLLRERIRYEREELQAANERRLDAQNARRMAEVGV